MREFTWRDFGRFLVPVPFLVLSVWLTVACRNYVQSHEVSDAIVSAMHSLRLGSIFVAFIAIVWAGESRSRDKGWILKTVPAFVGIVFRMLASLQLSKGLITQQECNITHIVAVPLFILGLAPIFDLKRKPPQEQIGEKA